MPHDRSIERWTSAMLPTMISSMASDFEMCRFRSFVLHLVWKMVFDANILQEKLIEAWKLRSDETSFSASLLPLIAECGSEEEFRTLFTSNIIRIVSIDSCCCRFPRASTRPHRIGYIFESPSILLQIPHSIGLHQWVNRDRSASLVEAVFIGVADRWWCANPIPTRAHLRHTENDARDCWTRISSW